MESVVFAGSLPIRPANSVLSMVRIWETLTTLALGRLASLFLRGTLPGAWAGAIRHVFRIDFVHFE
jgi:hypothetical protein